MYVYFGQIWNIVKSQWERKFEGSCEERRRNFVASHADFSLFSCGVNQSSKISISRVLENTFIFLFFFSMPLDAVDNRSPLFNSYSNSMLYFYLHYITFLAYLSQKRGKKTTWRPPLYAPYIHLVLHLHISVEAVLWRQLRHAHGNSHVEEIFTAAYHCPQITFQKRPWFTCNKDGRCIYRLIINSSFSINRYFLQRKFSLN